jgi:hypothetical protein
MVVVDGSVCTTTKEYLSGLAAARRHGQVQRCVSASRYRIHVGTRADQDVSRASASADTRQMQRRPLIRSPFLERRTLLEQELDDVSAIIGGSPMDGQPAKLIRLRHVGSTGN